MKLVPFIIHVPEHYAEFMGTVETVAPGEWDKWATQLIAQSLDREELGYGEESLINFIVESRTFDRAGDREAAEKIIAPAWSTFIQADVDAAVSAFSP